jgi:hypothetical protein
VREELISRNPAKLVTTSNPEYDVGAGLDPGRRSCAAGEDR